MELNITLGPEWLQKIMVVSHERSGTHFLMNTLAQNFGYISNDWIDLDVNMPINFWNPTSFLEVIRFMKDEPIATLFKSHHQVDFFLPILREILESFFIFYIYRDGKQVMESLCKHIKQLNLDWFAGPEAENGEELAKMAPCAGLLRYQWIQHETIWDRWQAHIDGWLKKIPLSLQNRVVYLKYEDLNEEFERSVRYIGNRIGLVPPDIPVRPTKFSNVITPEIEKKEASYG